MAGVTETAAEGAERARWDRAPDIPGYRIEHTLGRGGTSAVYRAIQLESGRAVALKVLVLDNAEDLGAALARLEREAHIGRVLEHPDIVPVLDFGKTAGMAWMAMEELDGFELTHALSDPSLGLADRLRVILRVAAALEHAHGHGIVHRDVKPSNIYMTRDGGVRLLDFGIAHVKVDLRLTRSGVIVGTPRYMAPEQVMGEDVDPRTDVFSLGIVLYQTLSGAMPWNGETAARLIIEVATKPPRPLQDALPVGTYDLSADQIERLAEVVHRALATDPAARYPTMTDFAAALRPFLDEPGAAAGSGPTPASPTAQRVQWALARAARLEQERSLERTPKDGLQKKAIDQTLSGAPDRLWLGLLALFGAGLAAALYLALR